MQLYGSTTSPYVRRLRMWLNDQPYQFINLDIFSEEGHAELVKHNPAMKVPMFKDDELTILDSRMIHRYLNEKLKKEQFNWHDENNLTLVDAANDSLVELLLLSRSGIAMDSEIMFVQRQQQRVAHLLKVLDAKVKTGEFDEWNYLAISLFCLLDWIEFRQLHDLSGYPNLSQFRATHCDTKAAVNTDPRG